MSKEWNQQTEDSRMHALNQLWTQARQNKMDVTAAQIEAVIKEINAGTRTFESSETTLQNIRDEISTASAVKDSQNSGGWGRKLAKFFTGS